MSQRMQAYAGSAAPSPSCPFCIRRCRSSLHPQRRVKHSLISCARLRPSSRLGGSRSSPSTKEHVALDDADW